ncbi:hypothetical protein EMA8858_00182 [Emticicia aquatica]|jgi:uncharacterized protein (DUF2141 family)|uniref:DUF2141 domain-containing protein n=1 Tax=Emticicia aquatica TaxID=1681835 RepID=A0ABM9AK48_9BACT|nr:DUF2141 domain-containing protein [Emticicia aquatica]CAH0994075.1 hypothetical protein EMA8858_00182 [Emticicia aquatica]
MKPNLFFSLLFLFCLNETNAQSATAFNLKISNLKSTSVIRIAFYKKENQFPDEKKFAFAKEFKPNKIGEATLSLTDIPTGEYALAVYQDLNGNKQLDTNIIGFPKEPFGFSQNVRPKFSAPDYDECKISYNANNTSFIIKLID